MSHKVTLDDNARAQRRRLSPYPRRDVNEVIDRLHEGPDLRQDVKLRDLTFLWRARAGRRWRVIFALRPGREIVIRRIARREVAYHHLADLDH